MIRRSDKYKAKHRLHAKKHGAVGSFDKWDVEIRLHKQKGQCHYCGVKLDLLGRNKFHVDHFIPLARGGSNFMNNIVCSCPGCNLSKANKMPWEFRPARFEVGCRRDG